MKKIAGNFHCIDCRFDMMIVVMAPDAMTESELEPIVEKEYNESDHAKSGHRVNHSIDEVA